MGDDVDIVYESLHSSVPQADGFKVEQIQIELGLCGQDAGCREESMSQQRGIHFKI